MNERDLKQLQIEVMNDLNKTENIIDYVKEIADYIILDHDFINDLYLIQQGLNDAIDRLSSSFISTDTSIFALSIQQLKMMAEDLLKYSKTKTVSA